MKGLSNCLVVIYAGLLILLSCTQPPELPVIPSIKFDNVVFKRANGPDSLIVMIDFKDGDGDLGLNPEDIMEPYHPYDVVLDRNGNPIEYGSLPGLPEYNPIDWLILEDNNGDPVDTILIDINENFFNYFVRFYEKKNGIYEEFIWKDEPFYLTFDGRFPYLNTSGKDRPLEGKLRYGMVSTGWLLVFRDSLKLSIQIQDRALNKSNIVESNPFTLEGITSP